MAFYARVRNGAVHLMKDDQGVPVFSFGHGARIRSALVSGDRIFCETEAGNTIVYRIQGNAAYMETSYM
jgi:hypothetical protein